MKRSTSIITIFFACGLIFSGPLWAPLIKPPLIPPQAPPPPALTPPPLLPPSNEEGQCGESVKVNNVTTEEVKMIHWWSDSKEPEVLSIRASAWRAVAPVYCSSYLIVTTGENLMDRVKMDPKKEYDIVWSRNESKYMIRERKLDEGKMGTGMDVEQKAEADG